LPYACLLSTKGAYYVANKQAQIEAKPKVALCLFICIFLSTKGAYYGAKHLLSTRGAYGA
jgi:hypothetical protein